jgi:pyruvate formate lyase activating enzyme
MARAIKLSGKYMTADEVFDIIAQDKIFYDKSGGGVTLSGGEPLLQAGFCFELAKKCAENNISVIIDTAGDVPLEIFEQLVPVTSCFYFDLKSDIDGYKKTGGDGERVYDNLLYLAKINKAAVRIPVIPGFNIKAMGNLADFLCGANIREVYILPFHRLGSGKYNALGLEYIYENFHLK